MKNIFKYILLPVSVVVLGGACSKYDAYKQFVPDGERIYPQKPDSLKAFSGKNRVMLSWMLIDPNVEYCEVSWNEGIETKTQKVEIAPRPVDNKFKVIIDGLDESSYVFNVASFDGYGNVSVKAEVEGIVYGDMYAASLMSRVARSVSVAGKEVSITWYSPVLKEIGIEITYTTVSDGEKKIVIPISETTTLLTDVNTAAPISYRTMYEPAEDVIDIFYTNPVTVILP